MKDLFARDSHNPILTADNVPVSAAAVLNPGATMQGDEVVLLLRVEDAHGVSSIYVARSANGVDGWQVQEKPIIDAGSACWPYEQWGCEDPRITYLPDRQAWHITYTAYSPAGAAVAMARTTDFVSAERLGLIFPPNNKDAALLPALFEGRYASLHRPDAGVGIQNIWMSYSTDLTYWGQPHSVLLEGAGPAWDAIRIGTGPPPIETPQGWLLIYHGVKLYAGSMVYRAGLALLDRHKPHKVKARSPQAIFRPSAHYELSGLVPNVVFPSGLLLRGDELWLYYGAADSSVCLATARLKDTLNVLEPA